MDETMSQDPAFTSENTDNDTFRFDEEESSTPASLTEIDNADTNSPSSEYNEVVEQKVPYSRFKKKVDELTETSGRIQFLEERLADLENSRTESFDEVEPDQEWIRLYGDSPIAREAYAVQLQREEQIREQAVRQAIDTMSRREEEEQERLVENEETIDENLESLSAYIGKKLTPQIEEEVLTIVDEFSPTGADGKYITLFPFDKAYEIYSLRNSQRGRATRQARQNVADLTGNTSDGESDESSSPFRRGWDSWRTEL